ncbi:hypothetical protein BS47DRAFT_1298922, partial [Hydnum rufescens UP504]
LESTIVYPVIQQIREDAIHYIDTPLTYDAMTAPDLSYTLVRRPLTQKYQKLQNMAVPFCLLLNRAYFLRDRNIATKSLSQSRAELCEIIAVRILRYWADETLDLATVMTTSWLVFAGADSQVLAKVEEEQEESIHKDIHLGNAIEMAIISDAKRFIKSSATQKIINAIWAGKIIYQAESDHAILADTYKRAPVHFYDPMRAPLLDHYRLKVPAVRAVLEYLNFVLLFILFLVVLETNEIDAINFPEWMFIMYAFGFTVDKLASMQEHGLKPCLLALLGFTPVHGILFSSLAYIPYLSLRFFWHQDRDHRRWAAELGIDILALAACFMFPRLAFVTLSNNLMVLSLRSMFVQFAKLMVLAIFCFGGFLYALWTRNLRRETRYSASQIAWWMADLWFGLDASGFDNAGHFHPVFGPPLMVVYACCSNTLLLTDAAQKCIAGFYSSGICWTLTTKAFQAMFRRAVQTIEGVKADVIFSYQPPLNIFAFLVMWPASFLLNPRWFHKFNVLMIRITSFPILLTIGIYERQTRGSPERLRERVSTMFDKIPRRLRPLTFLEGLGGQGSEIDAIFEIEARVVDEYLNEQLDDHEIPSKPQTPTHSQSSPLSNHSSPSIEIPGAKSPSSPPVMFPGSQTPSPGPERPFMGSGSLNVFGEPESPKMSDHPMRYRLSPRPLPPRHVRTRRDSLFQRYRATPMTIANNGGLGAANASISTVLDLEPDSTLDTSPLGMLFGTVVQEGGHDPFAT